MGTDCSLYRLKRPELDFNEMSEMDVEHLVLDRAYVFDSVDTDSPWHQKITGYQALYIVQHLKMLVLVGQYDGPDSHQPDRKRYRLHWLNKATDFINENLNAQYVFVRDTYNWPHF